MQRLFAALGAVLFAIQAAPALACQPFGVVEIEKLRAAGVPVELVEGEIAAWMANSTAASAANRRCMKPPLG